MGANAPYLYTYVLNLAKNINKIKVYVKIALHYCNTVFFIFAPHLPYWVQIYPCKCLISSFRHKILKNYPQVQKNPAKRENFLSGRDYYISRDTKLHPLLFFCLITQSCWHISVSIHLTSFFYILLYTTVSFSSPWP